MSKDSKLDAIDSRECSLNRGRPQWVLFRSVVWGNTAWRLIVCSLALGLLLACAPLQPVRPYPEFIRAAVIPGDRVEITMQTGESYRVQVTRVEKYALIAGDQQFNFAEIARIGVRSWARPDQACGGDRALECSIPPALFPLVEPVDELLGVFDPACVQHDFCYRHGAKTYAKTRLACDEEFKQNLLTICASKNLFDQFELSTNSASCRLIGHQMYRAVREYGERNFLSTNSTYCEYDGPPQGPVNRN